MTLNAAFLVAERAYSAATLLCLSGNEIRLGHYAGLSPIDITLVSEPSEGKREEVELATVDGFIEFAKNARKAIEDQLRKMDSNSETNVDSELLVAMVRSVGALQVGKFFRERNVTGFYAKELLGTYMFSNFSDSIERTDDLVQNLLHGAPSLLLPLRLSSLQELEGGNRGNVHRRIRFCEKKDSLKNEKTSPHLG